jgi:hypothetical protein
MTPIVTNGTLTVRSKVAELPYATETVAGWFRLQPAKLLALTV